MSNYTNWPVREFERVFYKEISIGGFGYLVPCGKLGRGQSVKAEAAKKEEAKLILSDSKLLASVRKEQSDSLQASITAAAGLIESSVTPEAKDRYARIHVSLLAQTLLPEEKEPTDADAEYYINKNRSDDTLHCAWTAALYIPLPGSPPVKEIYPYIPPYVLLETQDFFVESLSAPEEKSSETLQSSTGGNG